ncbi:MAG TPA: flagellar basal body P-ring formation chaperone FlgA [Bryobacteraceae bacterium]|nr:flagellar basal body P-ring formation chaperone FlgA [Bryobacteraceae bacterium]
MMLTLLLAFLVPPLACHSIHSDWISGRDLAQANPAFSNLPPDLQLSPSPIPGQQRIFRSGELRRIAVANHLQLSIYSDTCFAWSVKIPDHGALVAAIEKTLAGRSPQVEVLEQSLIPAPEGDVIFPLSGMSGISSHPIIWRGFVMYAGNRHFPIWARVQVTVTEPRVLTANPIRTGDILSQSGLRLETYKGPADREAAVTDLSSAIGMIARRDIPAGSPISESMIAKPRDVERGDLVSVTAQSGAAIVQAQGLAEQSGRRGDVITVRNPRTGKTFHARVQDKGTVLVVPGGSFGLVGDTLAGGRKS